MIIIVEFSSNYGIGIKILLSLSDKYYVWLPYNVVKLLLKKDSFKNYIKLVISKTLIPLCWPQLHYKIQLIYKLPIYSY